MAAIKHNSLSTLVRGSARRTAIGLFDLQVWLWGQDILHSRGNGLVRFGFHRQPAPADTSASSMYRLPLSRGRRITLRGFGMYYSDRRVGGIFLERFVFHPRMSAALDLPEDAWFRPQLDDLHAPKTPREQRRAEVLLHGAVRWLIRYERWAWETLGHAHRRRAVQQWADLNKFVVPAGELATAWRDWLKAVRQLRERQPFTPRGAA